MRRLLPLLLLCVMLLSGCSGGIAPIVPPIIEPEEPEEPVYDGEPTSLIVKLQRGEVASTKSLGFRSELTDTAYIRIEKENEHGLIVYRNMYKATIPADQPEIILPFELPADQGYEVRGNVYHDDLLLGSAQPTTFDAPAKTVTTATLPLDPPDWEFFYELPDALYSGGDLGQLRAKTVPLNYWVRATVFCGFEPWDTNVNPFHPPQGIYQVGGSSNPPLPPITEPQKLYYQVVVSVSNEYEDTWEYAFQHFPDLTVETDLPFIWCYPDPSWTE